MRPCEQNPRCPLCICQPIFLRETDGAVRCAGCEIRDDVEKDKHYGHNSFINIKGRKRTCESYRERGIHTTSGSHGGDMSG